MAKKSYLKRLWTYAESDEYGFCWTRRWFRLDNPRIQRPVNSDRKYAGDNIRDLEAGQTTSVRKENVLPKKQSCQQEHHTEQVSDFEAYVAGFFLICVFALVVWILVCLCDWAYNAWLDREHVVKGYFKNGDIRIEETYKNRKLNGLTVEYYPGNKVKAKKKYVAGKLNGVTQVYYESGVLKQTVEYKNNRKNGESVAYHQNGKIQSTATMKNDKINGVAILYDESGRIIRKDQFINGVSVNVIE